MTAIPLGTDLVLARVQDGIGWLTLNNVAKRNAITVAMWEAMATATAAFIADDAVRLVVLHGAGGRSFAAGADIGEMERMRGRAAPMNTPPAPRPPAPCWTGWKSRCWR